MMSPFQIIVLDIIKSNDGRFSWYQIDRALSQRSVSPRLTDGLMPALRELEETGLITRQSGHHPAQPLYSITADGQRLLEVKEDEVSNPTTSEW